MGGSKNDKFDRAQQFNNAANNTANQIPQQTTATSQYISPRALERLRALDEQGSAALKGYELFDPEQFAEREEMRRTGFEALNAPLVNPNFIAAVSEQMKDTRMRDRANSAMSAFQIARANAINEAYGADADRRDAMQLQLQGQLGAAGTQVNLAQAHNNRRRWYDPILSLSRSAATATAGLG
jgi:phage I-like protein